MASKISGSWVRANLSAHSALALFVAGLMYLVCLTGVICIYYPELERWEQPQVAEFTQASPQLVQQALDNLVARYPDAHSFEDLWVGLPTVDAPRMSVGGELKGEELQFYVNPDASLGAAAEDHWTHFITQLHYALTLPALWGMALVGIIGVLLVALVVSGLLAHPKLIKNAFSLRLERGERQRQVDMHNRLGVWASPFILVIALSGALIGLGQPLTMAFAQGFFGGDTSKLTGELYLPHPEPSDQLEALMPVAPTLAAFSQQQPNQLPYYLAIHAPASANQTLELGVYLPDRLVWYDAYQFNAQGEQTAQLNWPEGDLGTQVYGSTYRLHFGHFGGLPVRILYTLLGLGLSFICATGMNIWFRRQAQAGQPRPRLERLWLGCVWGVPAALSLTLVTNSIWAEQAVAIFWVSLALLLALSQWVKQRQSLSLILRSLVCVLLTVTLALQLIRFGSLAFSPASLMINLLLLLALVTMGWGLQLSRKSLRAGLNSQLAPAPQAQPQTQTQPQA